MNLLFTKPISKSLGALDTKPDDHCYGCVDLPGVETKPVANWYSRNAWDRYGSK